MKAGFLDKLLEKIQRVQPDEISLYLQELAREKGVLETVFNALLEGVIVIDPQEHVIYLNRMAGEFFGLSLSDSLGKKLSQLIPGIPLHSTTDQGQVLIRDMEIFYPQHRFLDSYSVPLPTDDSSLESGYAIILRDSTNSRKEQASTLEIERSSLATLLAASVAHEIGNPLNSLTIHLHLLERKLKQLQLSTEKQLLSSLSIAQGEVERLDHIITQFLTAIRPTPLSLKKDNLNKIIQESLSFLEEEINDRNIELTLQLASKIPLRAFDSSQIKQALYNMLRNSFQAMQQTKKLEIITGYDDSYLWVSIGDTGGGIAQNDFEKIFEPYFTNKAEGSGLGLYIIERIVKAHHGDLLLENRPGQGVLFTLRFLRDDCPVRALPTSEVTNPYLLPEKSQGVESSQINF